MASDPVAFKATVQESLRRHAAAINILAARGLAFWDYGNSFLLEAFRAGADVAAIGGATATGGGPKFRCGSDTAAYLHTLSGKSSPMCSVKFIL